MKIIIAFILSVLVTACEKPGTLESTKQKAQAEQEAGKEVDNRNLEEKAKKMETELANRHIYYAALVGTYEGDVKVENETYKIKIIISKSIPPYSGDRVRQLSEIESDLINLNLILQIVQWHPSDVNTGVGCRIGQVKPNADRGVLTVASQECPNAYTIYLSEKEVKGLDNKENIAERIAQQIKDHSLNEVEGLVGTIQPSFNANTYTFIVRRKE